MNNNKNSYSIEYGRYGPQINSQSLSNSHSGNVSKLSSYYEELENKAKDSLSSYKKTDTLPSAKKAENKR